MTNIIADAVMADENNNMSKFGQQESVLPLCLLASRNLLSSLLTVLMYRFGSVLYFALCVCVCVCDVKAFKLSL
jgi:hypothetical protein